jgi:hypothetical protein
MLQNSKSQLAKLLATENLTVEHRKVRTAYFNTKVRTLVVPILSNDLPSYVYDLFIGHEVGHALFTPNEGWHDSIIDLKIPRSILNVLEDCRIEKLIKRKYPGLKSEFSKGYRDLYGRDFFSLEGVDVNTLNLIDRINIQYKLGALHSVNFDDTEKEIISEVDALETFDQVVVLARKIQTLMAEQKQKKQSQQDYQDNEKEDTEEKQENEGDFDDSYLDDFEQSDDTNDNASPTPSGNQDDGEQSDDELPETIQSGSSDDEMTEKDDSDLESKTDNSFRQNEEKLIDHLSREIFYGNIPDVNIDTAIVTHKTIIRRTKNYRDRGDFLNENDKTLFTEFRKNSNKVVSYLVKEFEMRKNAEQQKRASIAKTGELNMNKIFSYQFNEDIFKRMTVVPGGKSHGLVMFLDWSGSMGAHLENTIKQLLNLVLFCKKVNIPYRVYAFTSDYFHDHPTTGTRHHHQQFKIGDIEMQQFHLLEFFNNTMSQNDFVYMSNLLLTIGKGMMCPDFLSMSYTPLNEAIFSAFKIIPKFKSENKLQIVNTVFLTDGEGHALKYVMQSQESLLANPRSDRISAYDVRSILRYKNSVSEIKDTTATQYTVAALKLLKEVTGCNVIGFYILNNRDFKTNAWKFLPSTVSFDDCRIKFRKDKSITITSAGYDEFYLLKSDSLDTDDDNEFVVSSNNSTRSLTTAFSKFATSKITNRVVLNKFIGMIA